ncbi:MAG: helix-turn-helix domain-containing protein [Micropruina sp.]|uniref:PucR family transcriptional regulator n=1 Tax=Micropruina sp. TaxID=2737536 RepID=UPI0039E513C4
MRPELQEVVDESSRLLQSATVLEDRNFNLLAYAAQPTEVDSVRRNSILQRRSAPAVRAWFESFGISDSTQPLRIPADPGAGLQARICFPARCNGTTYGYLWALDEETPLTDPAVAEVAKLTAEAAVYLARIGRQRSEVSLAVADLIGADADNAQAAAERLIQRGLLDRQAPLTVVVITETEGSPPRVTPSLWGQHRQLLVDVGPGGAVAVLPLRTLESGDQARDAATAILDLYASELPEDWEGRLAAGVGRPRGSVTELHRCWLEARTAARIAGTSRRERVAMWDDLGPYRLLEALPAAQLSAIVLDGPLQRLLATGDAELIRTVEVFLDRAGNVAEAAAALHVHRQTLYYRLGKVETITGLRFSSGPDRVRLQLGLMLAPFLNE